LRWKYLDGVEKSDVVLKSNTSDDDVCDGGCDDVQGRVNRKRCPDWIKHKSRIQLCGKGYVAYQCEHGCETQYRVFYCESRLCPECAKRKHVERMKALLKLHWINPAHLMLSSILVRKEGIAGAIERIKKSFFKYKRLKGVSRRLEKGTWNVEVKKSEKKDVDGACLFYVHLHLLVDGKYVCQKELSDEWERLTGAKVVWIRKLYGRNLNKGILEGTKYITEGIVSKDKVDAWSDDELKSLYLAIYGKNTFGVWGWGEEWGRAVAESSLDNIQISLQCSVCGGRMKYLEVWDNVDLEYYKRVFKRVIPVPRARSPGGKP
jgi:hypothetical protein